MIFCWSVFVQLVFLWPQKRMLVKLPLSSFTKSAGLPTSALTCCTILERACRLHVL